MYLFHCSICCCIFSASFFKKMQKITISFCFLPVLQMSDFVNCQLFIQSSATLYVCCCYSFSGHGVLWATDGVSTDGPLQGVSPMLWPSRWRNHGKYRDTVNSHSAYPHIQSGCPAQLPASRLNIFTCLLPLISFTRFNRKPIILCQNSWHF